TRYETARMMRMTFHSPDESPWPASLLKAVTPPISTLLPPTARWAATETSECTRRPAEFCVSTDGMTSIRYLPLVWERTGSLTAATSFTFATASWTDRAADTLL